MAIKNAPKSIVTCPEIKAKDRKEAVAVSLNSDGTAYKVQITMLVGVPEIKMFVKNEGKKNEEIIEYVDSGVLILDGLTIEIGGVEHRLTVRKAQFGEKGRAGQDCIVCRPVNQKAPSVKKEVDEIPF